MILLLCLRTQEIEGCLGIARCSHRSVAMEIVTVQEDEEGISLGFMGIKIWGRTRKKSFFLPKQEEVIDA
ncbi:MAG: hypothetical protein A2Y65_04425 [Deltaproteobacteria bacterium RBG_13_52_11]|nr:MAG: hypothetical protein A2Y65_04425 [Deltaproteobacteria bacterium RBG_13_52_11]